MTHDLPILLLVSTGSMLLGYALRMAQRDSEWVKGWREGFRAGRLNDKLRQDAPANPKP